MRRLLALAAGVGLVVALSSPSSAAEMTIRGEVVDIACATKKGTGGHGDDHASCAMACAKRGQPVGVMTADGIYVIMGDYAASNNAKVLDFVAKRVDVRGEITEKDGQQLINVSSITLAR